MPEYAEIIGKMAKDILANNKPEKITRELVNKFVENKKEYLDNFDEWDYEADVWEKLEEMLGNNVKVKEESEQKPKKAEQKGKSVKKSQKTEVKTKLWEFKCYSGLWKKLIARVKPLADEIKLNITNEGVSTLTVDPAHVCMVDLKIPRKDFYTGNSCVNKNVAYKLKEPLEIGVDLAKFEKTMKLFSSYDYITGYILGNTLYLDSEKIHKKLQLIDTRGMPNATIPKIEFDVEAKVSNSDINLLLKALGDNTEYLTLISDKTGLYTIIEEDEDDLRIDLSDEAKGKGKALYSSDYFKKIVNGLTHWKSVTFEFSTDNPIQISGEIYEDGNFRYLLAPRIESE